MQLLLEVTALVSHAPILLPQLEGPRVAETAPIIRAALRSIDLHRCETIVIVSPHGRSTGVYKRVCGSLQGFGVTEVDVDHTTDPLLTRKLADDWDEPLLDDPIDFGITVPLALQFVPEVPVVAATVAEDERDPIAAGVKCARAIASSVMDQPVGVLYSAHTSATLSARAPVFLPEEDRVLAREDEVDLLETLQDKERDPLHALARMTKSHSCSPATLAGFAASLGSERGSTLAYQEPLGVGYLIQASYRQPRRAARDVSDPVSDITHLDV